jgi:hypothetical protein
MRDTITYQDRRRSLCIALFLISLLGGGHRLIAQEATGSDFMLERLRFQAQMGYWMNDPLYEFAVKEATREDYCSQDLKQAYRRIDELSEESEVNRLMVRKFQSKCENAEALLDGQSVLLDGALAAIEKQERKTVRWRRFSLITGIAGVAGGVYLGSR